MFYKRFQCKDLPEISVIRTKLQADMNTLKGRQYSNGGFGYWTNRSDSNADPFISVHAAHCLVVVMAKTGIQLGQQYDRQRTGISGKHRIRNRIDCHIRNIGLKQLALA